MTDKEIAKYFQALNSENAIRIIKLIMDKAIRVFELSQKLQITCNAIDYHLLKFRNTGIVAYYTRDKHKYYYLKCKQLSFILDTLREI